MKRIISMAVVLVITMAATAQKGELAMNENISGKNHISLFDHPDIITGCLHLR